MARKLVKFDPSTLSAGESIYLIRRDEDGWVPFMLCRDPEKGLVQRRGNWFYSKSHAWDRGYPTLTESYTLISFRWSSRCCYIYTDENIIPESQIVSTQVPLTEEMYF